MHHQLPQYFTITQTRSHCGAPFAMRIWRTSPSHGQVAQQCIHPTVRRPEPLQAAPVFLARNKPTYGAVRGDSRCPLSPRGFLPAAWPGLKGNERSRAVNPALARASLARLSAQPLCVGLHRVTNTAAKPPSAPRGGPAVLVETQRDSTRVPAAPAL